MRADMGYVFPFASRNHGRRNGCKKGQRMLNKQDYQITLGVGIACLISAVILLVMSQLSGMQQKKLQGQQNSIANINQMQQVFNSLLQDIAESSTRSANVKGFLAKVGVTVQPANPAAAAPAAMKK